MIGSEFIDFISVCLTYQLKNLFEKEELFDKKTYKQIMRILEHAKKVSVNEGDWMMVKTNKNQREILQRLGVLTEQE